MSAKQVEKPKVEKIEPKKSEAELQQEALEKKAILDGLNSQKLKKDAQLKTVDELHLHIKQLHNEINSLVADHETKRRANESLANSIRSAQTELALFEKQFADKNAKRLAELDKKLKEVAEADATMQALIRENRETKQNLAREKSLFVQERENNRQLVHAANTALNQNNAQWKVKEEDLLQREAALKADKEAFESYKDSLNPEIARITSIKNENELLLQKIEMQRLDMERLRASSIREKEVATETALVSKAKSEQDRQRIANEEARLRKWEQDLKDSALEMRAREAEYNRVIRREKLEAEIKQAEGVKGGN